MSVIVTIRDLESPDDFNNTVVHLKERRRDLWYLHCKYPPVHLQNSWIYFAYRGVLRGRARIADIKKVAKPIEMVTGDVKKPNQWWLVYVHPMELPNRRIKCASFQGYRYLTPQQSKLFISAFPLSKNRRAKATNLSLLDQDNVREGRKYLAQHYARERNSRRIVQNFKRERYANTGRLECDACRFDYAKQYGDYGSGYIECHHNVPLYLGERNTRKEDLRLVCANCHRMLHQNLRCMTIAVLKKLLQECH